MLMNINGREHEVDSDPSLPLVQMLRELGLKGTKLGCGSGECGACTVIVDDKAVCACLFPAGRAIGRRIETIEGVGTVESPHPLQRALHEHGAFQCGFCTPGTVMSLLALLRANPKPSETEMRIATQGNVCRCSGYQLLREAVAAYIDEDA